MLKVDMSGFKPVETKEQEKRIMKDYVFYAVDGKLLKISAEDVALAVALTPVNTNASIICPYLRMALVSITGNRIIHHMIGYDEIEGMEKQNELISKVTEYRQSKDEDLFIYYAPERD